MFQEFGKGASCLQKEVSKIHQRWIKIKLLILNVYKWPWFGEIVSLEQECWSLQDPLIE